ncbi:MAG TPA: 30S ribosomal protein S18 [Candidatus Paceibacterota bacterium]|nr:30S ribosomal protein S18 [Candidatus Paceibacterota bacterium]
MIQDYFFAHGITNIDYKDTEILKRFLSPSGKIMPRGKSGLSAKHQRQMTEAVKRARFLGLLPFIAR